MFDPQDLLPFFSTIPSTSTLWIAYSGGVDSHVLLHALASLSQRKLRALHINHGLSPNAVKWQAHCREVCAELGIPFQALSVCAKSPAGESPEAFARKARYQALAEQMEPGDYLLTAHHQDDQAETLLLQLFRGAGTKGLASMPKQISFGPGYLWRPLLAYRRDDLLVYARAQQLCWIEDESNDNTAFDRNFIRHHVLPMLQQRWPALTATLARTATHCAEADQLLDVLAAEDVKQVQGHSEAILSIDKIVSLTAGRQRHLLRYWLRQLGFAVPTEAQLKRIQRDVLSCALDANPIVRYADVEVRRYRDALYAKKQQTRVSLTDLVLPWDLNEIFMLPHDQGVLRVCWEQGRGIRSLSEHERAQLTVRFRQGGEVFHPLGRQGSHPLKKLWQEWGVPPWQRNHVPLIYQGEQLICVVGYAIAASHTVLTDEWGWEVECISPN